MNGLRSNRLRDAWAWLFLGGVLLVLLASILIANDGVFVYTLDDPYIHLQFSTQIARGHFGLVPEEPSSPSSSILWPLLLAPFAFSAWHEFVPLALGIAATFASFALWRYALQRFVLRDAGPHGTRQADLLALVALLGTNAAGLPFSGMEHSLQITATLAALAGAIELIETGRVRWWLILGVIAGPLLRYENIPISATVLAAMLACGAFGWAAICGATVAAGLGSFAYVSLSLGLPPVPGSLQLKSSVAAEQFPLWTQIRSMAGHFLHGLVRARWYLEGLPLIPLLLLRVLWPTGLRLAHWLLLGGVGASMVLQMAYGGHFNLGRYDSAFFNAGLLCCAFFYRDALQAALRKLAAFRLAIAAGALVAALLPLMASSLALTAWASQDIYRQQWQMRRFMAALGNEAVAVGDVGLASYRTTWRVSDLVGLGSDEIRRLHRAGEFSDDRLAALLAERQTRVAMVFPSMAQTHGLTRYELVARFDLGRDRVSTGGREVLVFATDPMTAARLRQKAREFAPTMPRGASLTVVPPD